MTVSSKWLFGVNDSVLVKVLAHLTITPTRSLMTLLLNIIIIMTRNPWFWNALNKVLTVSIGVEPLSSVKCYDEWLVTKISGLVRG